MNPAKPQIVKQQLALDNYLQNLLDAVPEAGEEQVFEAPPLIITAPPVKLAMPVARPVISVSESKSVAEVTTEAADTVVASANATKLQALSVMPEWSRQEFQALFFKLENLILAAPLTELARTIKIERQPRPVPGQPDWFLGLLDDHESRIGVLDTGQLVFGKTRGKQRNLEQKPFQHILITSDCRWGLAFDEVVTIGRLQPDKVRWRTSRQKQPWLIGTVIEELTAVIDIRQLVPHRTQ
jgi:purine-binding chemotaxis protein CheW